MKKIFALAALALCLAACNKQEVQPVEQNDGMITLTATIAPKGAATKAITDNNDGKITATWALGDKLVILYDVSGTRFKAEAEVKSVDASGTAIIQFDVEAGTMDGTACTVIYPAAAAKEDASGVRSDLELLGNQPGELSNKMDIRVTTGVITPVTPDAGLDLDAPLAPKYAIFKLNLENTDSSPVTAKSLYVTIGSDVFVIKPTTPASELYVALPPASGQKVIFTAMGETNRCFSKPGVTIEAGKYYRSTLKMAAQSDNPDYVAMGDGLKWATRNLGASAPHEYGDYYAWGETAPYYQDGYSQESPMADAHWKTGKSGYNWANYGFTTDGGSTFTKYTGSDYDVLQAVDDAATKTLGSSWRMPTNAEWQALLNTSDFTWAWVTNFNNTGKNGRLVISKKSGYEGNSIFLPAAGFRDDAYLNSAGSNGLYWSSSLYTGNPSYAYNVYFGSGDADWSCNHRDYGRSVRPVTE